MGKLEKLIQKILDKKQVSYDEAERVLFSIGFKVKITGSHCVFRKKGYSHNISLKKRRYLLAYQMKMLRKVLIDHGYQNEK